MTRTLHVLTVEPAKAHKHLRILNIYYSNVFDFLSYLKPLYYTHFSLFRTYIVAPLCESVVKLLLLDVIFFIFIIVYLKIAFINVFTFSVYYVDSATKSNRLRSAE